MSYDLTAFLTTVAASSASIVAILGGFIASKLITISGERDALLDKLNSIDEELRFKKEELKSYQIENDTSDALSFIHDHIEALLKQSTINNVYDSAENYGISKERIKPYWDRALIICKDFFESDHEGAALNSDGIPRELACKYSNDKFSYEVLLILMRYVEKVLREEERRKREEERKRDPFASMISSPDYNHLLMDNIESIHPLSSTLNYTRNEQEIDKLTSSILFLEFQREQLELQRKTLVKPKGMKAGLVIFALFAIACIIVPLAMCPRYTESLCTFWTIKIIILVLFISGMMAIFGYLVYLLQWKTDTNKKKNEE